MVHVDTRTYEAAHGHTPRQPRGYRVSPWAFTVDGNDAVIRITASYKEALRHAKRQARYRVQVLP